MRSKNTCYEIANKDLVVKEFGRISEQVGPLGLVDVKQDSPLVYAVDRVLKHGLRDPVQGYWSLVRSLTHSTTLKSLEAFVKYISSSHQKGIAWTFYTMEEGSLEYYLSSLLHDTKTLQQHYVDQSVLRDVSLAQRVVETITTLRSEAAAIQASMESSLVSEGLPESTPSLTSPVDSGVALLDSDSTSDGEKNEVYRRQRQSTENCAPRKQMLSNSGESTFSDNTLAGDSDIQNSNSGKPETATKTNGIIAQTNKYDGVCRRPRKKKKSESSKRVSFHQDSSDDAENNVTMRQPSNMNRFYVEGRYSWAGEGDSFFLKENQNFRQVKSEIYERKGLSSSISIFESELGIEADCDSSTTTLDDAKNNIEMVCEKLTNVVKQSLGLKTKDKAEGGISINSQKYKSPLIAERGVPEGQEDPAVFSEYESLLTAQQRSLTAMRSSMDLTSDSEWSLDTADKLQKRQQFLKHSGLQRNSLGAANWPARVLYETPSKTSLVRRFLHSIPTRKPYKEKKQAKPNLYIKGVKPDPVLIQELITDLNKEMEQNQPTFVKGEDEVVTEGMKTALKASVLVDENEKILKVYRVSSTDGEPLLAVLTDTALYMTGLDTGCKYSSRHHISYHTLDTVVIGPEYQTVMLITVDHSVTVTVISALGQALVTHMVSHLAFLVLRATRTHLSVCQLNLSSMESLYRAIITHTSVSKDEQLHYYKYIRVEDTHITHDNPVKCGHLMYRSHNHSPWLPGYIVLKGGVLYVFSDVYQHTPKHVLSLEHGYFGGCRRVFNSNRPHTFEILPFSQRGLYGTFQFAAADDYETSDWLQAFIRTSSALCGKVSREPLLGCGLLLTSHHLLTLDFPDTVLSCARIQDISTVRTDMTCCVLETSCREVQESGGDWILYFLTEQAITQFLDTLFMLRPELKQSVVDTWECEALHAHCVKTSQLVRDAWNPLLTPSVKQSSR